jgi:hypothetical protein
MPIEATMRVERAVIRIWIRDRQRHGNERRRRRWIVSVRRIVGGRIQRVGWIIGILGCLRQFLSSFFVCSRCSVERSLSVRRILITVAVLAHSGMHPFVPVGIGSGRFTGGRGLMGVLGVGILLLGHRRSSFHIR